MSRTAARAALPALLALASAGAQEPAPRAEVPFEVHGARVFVPVTVDGHGPYPFILDTGSGGCVIDARLADALHLASTPVGEVRGAGSGAMRSARSGPATLAVGGVPLRVASLGVSPIDSLLAPYAGTPQPGIVGGPFFAAHVVELDFARRRMRVWDRDVALARPDAVRVPIRVDGVPHATAVMTAPDGRADTLDVLVDTGAKLTLHVTERTDARLGLSRRFPHSVYTPLGAGVGGETRYRMVRVPALGIPGAPATTYHDGIAGLSADGTLRSTYYDALLGYEYLSRFRLVIDYPHARLLLEPTPALASPEPFDRSGLFLVAAASGPLVVRHVVDGSPAAAAGITVGDTVLALDGHAMGAADLLAVRAALTDGSRATATLRVSRGDAAREVVLRLRDLLAPGKP